MRLQSINRDIRSRTSLPPAEAATTSSAKLNWPTLRSDIVPSRDSNSQKWNHTYLPYAKPSQARAIQVIIRLVRRAAARLLDGPVTCSYRGHSRHLFGDMTDTFGVGQVDGSD